MSPRRRPPITIVVSTALFLVVSEAHVAAQDGAERAAQTAEARQAYEATIREAVDEFNADRFPEALVLFERAHATMPNARTSRGIGMCAFEMRDYPRALVSLRDALASRERPLNASQRRDVEALLARTETFLGRVELVGLPENADVRVDGAPAIFDGPLLLLGAGVHDITVDAGEGRHFGRSIEAAPSHALRIEVDFPAPRPAGVVVPAPTEVAATQAEASEVDASHLAKLRDERVPLRRKWWFWTVIGVAVVAAVAVPLAVHASQDPPPPYATGDYGTTIFTRRNL